MTDITWMSRAACRGQPTKYWFPTENRNDKSRYQTAETMVAKAFCEVCPVAVECLAWAIRNKDQDGIFGGLEPKERRSLVRKQGVRFVSSGPWEPHKKRGEKPVISNRTHGLIATYQSGCRCDQCRDVAAAARRALRAKKSSTGTSGISTDKSA